MASGFEVVGIILSLADVTATIAFAVKSHIDAKKQIAQYLDLIHDQLVRIKQKCDALKPEDACSWLHIAQNLYTGVDDLRRFKEDLDEVHRKLSAPAITRWRFSRSAMAHDLLAMNARLANLEMYLGLALLIVENAAVLSAQLREGFATAALARPSQELMASVGSNPRTRTVRLYATIRLSRSDREMLALIAGDASDMTAHNPDILYRVGFHLKCGNIVPRDYKHAARFYKMAARLGSADGNFELGELYSQGWGVSRDIQRGFTYYERSARLGSPLGMVNTGIYYRDGSGVEQDNTRAVQYFDMAIGAREPDAVANLAFMYPRMGDTHHCTEIVPELVAVAAKGSIVAHLALGVYYTNGLGVKANPRIAAAHYRAAADGGNFFGFLHSAVRLQAGYGIPRDPDTASGFFDLLRDIATPDQLVGIQHETHGFSACLRGSLFEHGLGVPQNDTLALRHYRDAETAGSDLALAHIAHFYENGRGVVRDWRQAASYYHRAAMRGIALAQIRCCQIYESGEHGVPKDASRAAQYAFMAAGQGDCEGKLIASRFCIKGLGVARDIMRAKRYIEDADKSGILMQFVEEFGLWDKLFDCDSEAPLLRLLKGKSNM